MNELTGFAPCVGALRDQREQLLAQEFPRFLDSQKVRIHPVDDRAPFRRLLASGALQHMAQRWQLAGPAVLIEPVQRVGHCEMLHAHAQMLPGDFLQLMGFVDDQVFIGWQKLMSGPHVGEQLRMIRDDDIRIARLMLCPVIVAFAEPRTGSSQA
ncbi:hypothetical protein D3C71_1365190 [compost metagenome]